MDLIREERRITLLEEMQKRKDQLFAENKVAAQMIDYLCSIIM